MGWDAGGGNLDFKKEKLINIGVSMYITVIFSVEYEKSCLKVNQSLNFHAYLWTLKYRIDSRHWSKASQGLDVGLLG